MSVELKVAPNGRVVIPYDIRRSLGLENGGSLWLEHTDEAIRLQTRVQRAQQARRMARELLKDYKGNLVDELSAGRRAEAGREAADLTAILDLRR